MQTSNTQANDYMQAMTDCVKAESMAFKASIEDFWKELSYSKHLELLR